MALGSEGFFSPEGLQGGENRGGGRGERPLREVREEGSRGGCPPPTAGSRLSILQGVPNAAVRVLMEVRFWKTPTPLAGLSGSHTHGLLLFTLAAC